MRRRDFIRSGAGLVSGAVLSSTLLRSGRARAFGAVPDVTAMLPQEHQVESVLEILLLGGVSQYESFFCVPEFGNDVTNPTQWYAFLGSGDVQAALDECEFDGDTPLLQPFGEDAEGRTVHLGPFTMPLRTRPDLLARLRSVFVTHDFAPHEVAIPMALTGRSPANPGMASLGAHVQRYFAEREGANGRAPFAYVLLPPSTIQQELARAAMSTGFHSGSARPLSLRIGSSSEDTAALLTRPGVPLVRRTAHDEFVAANIERYQSRLAWRGGGGPLRAPRLEEFLASSNAVANSQALQGILEASFFDPLVGSSCGSSAVNATAMSLRLAAHLLKHDTQPARYVCVVDGGFGSQSDAGGYDSHEQNSVVQARNLRSTLESLASIINGPEENDKSKLDLDKTLIILNTEFGRTPDRQGNKGRGHWPSAFPVVMLGGPVAGDGAGIYGAHGADARPILAMSPVTHRIAALLALGIWPFEPEAYNVGDVENLTLESQVIAIAAEQAFGVRL